MFDGVHFTGTVNLGNLTTAIVNLIGVIALYIRIKAKLKEYSMRDKLPGGKRKGDPPPALPPQSSDQGPVLSSTNNFDSHNHQADNKQN